MVAEEDGIDVRAAKQQYLVHVEQGELAEAQEIFGQHESSTTLNDSVNEAWLRSNFGDLRMSFRDLHTYVELLSSAEADVLEDQFNRAFRTVRAIKDAGVTRWRHMNLRERNWREGRGKYLQIQEVEIRSRLSTLQEGMTDLDPAVVREHLDELDHLLDSLKARFPRFAEGEEDEQAVDAHGRIEKLEQWFRTVRNSSPSSGVTPDTLREILEAALSRIDEDKNDRVFQLGCDDPRCRGMDYWNLAAEYLEMRQDDPGAVSIVNRINSIIANDPRAKKWAAKYRSELRRTESDQDAREWDDAIAKVEPVLDEQPEFAWAEKLLIRLQDMNFRSEAAEASLLVPWSLLKDTPTDNLLTEIVRFRPTFEEQFGPKGEQVIQLFSDRMLGIWRPRAEFLYSVAPLVQKGLDLEEKHVYEEALLAAQEAKQTVGRGSRRIGTDDQPLFDNILQALDGWMENLRDDVARSQIVDRVNDSFQQGSTLTGEWLIDHGDSVAADLEYLDQRGMAPLDAPISKRVISIVQLLQEQYELIRKHENGLKQGPEYPPMMGFLHGVERAEIYLRNFIRLSVYCTKNERTGLVVDDEIAGSILIEVGLKIGRLNDAKQWLKNRLSETHILRKDLYGDQTLSQRLMNDPNHLQTISELEPLHWRRLMGLVRAVEDLWASVPQRGDEGEISGWIGLVKRIAPLRETTIRSSIEEEYRVLAQWIGVSTPAFDDDWVSALRRIYYKEFAVRVEDSIRDQRKVIINWLQLNNSWKWFGSWGIGASRRAAGEWSKLISEVEDELLERLDEETIPEGERLGTMLENALRPSEHDVLLHRLSVKRRQHVWFQGLYSLVLSATLGLVAIGLWSALGDIEEKRPPDVTAKIQNVTPIATNVESTPYFVGDPTRCHIDYVALCDYHGAKILTYWEQNPWLGKPLIDGLYADPRISGGLPFQLFNYGGIVVRNDMVERILIGRIIAKIRQIDDESPFAQVSRPVVPEKGDVWAEGHTVQAACRFKERWEDSRGAASTEVVPLVWPISEAHQRDSQRMQFFYGGIIVCVDGEPELVPGGQWLQRDLGIR